MASNIDSIKMRFGIVGHNPKLKTALEIAIQVAPTDVSVLIVGENGTGKDVFSRIIHQFSKRKHQNFIAINTGAIPEGTMDSELFGHEKGSFTGAIETRKGYFEEVDAGTIFLDEIGEMPMATQARLLRLLENQEYLRVGSSKIKKADVRVITATNKNLIEQIRKGKFREDLYFRLNTITINVPALRDRGGDIEMLFQYFSDEFANEYKRMPLSLTPDAIDLIYQYRWPGNVRELKNFVHRLTVLVREDEITADIIRQHLNMRESYLPVFMGNEPVLSEDGQGNQRREMEILYKLVVDMRRDVDDLKRVLSMGMPGVNEYAESHEPIEDDGETYIIEPSGRTHSEPFRGNREQPVSVEGIKPGNNSKPRLLEQPLNLEHNEKDLIARSLGKHSDNRKKAAQELGISERTLYRKIKQYGLG
ncbi:MAG: sigma-54-dependent Fis family transcriptional regulator [Bacteroidetes bacterium]|nr:sigma-54-dependent Fis family transcriptional regulator [Bacteroidota bacterium]